MVAPVTRITSTAPTTTEHAYLRAHRISGRSLRFRLASEESALRERAASSSAGRAGKTLVKEGALRIMQLALSRGMRLPWREISGATSIQVLQGRVQMKTSDGKMDLLPGALVALDAGMPHTAIAMSDCVMLFTIAMPDGEVRM